MKPSRTANIALVLVAIGWLLAFYGALSQLGDPAPWISQATVEAHRQISAVVLLAGIVVLLTSLWLSGYSYAQAKWRASIAGLLCIAPVIAIYATTFLRHMALNLAPFGRWTLRDKAAQRRLALRWAAKP